MQNQEKNPKPTVDVTVYYHKEMKLESKTRTLKEVLELVWNSPGFENHSPLKLIFNGTKKILYMDENMCRSFLNGQLSLAEFIEATECDELYRNSVEIKAKTFNVEAGHIWKCKQKKLILVDDDQFVTETFNDKKFIIIK